MLSKPEEFIMAVLASLWVVLTYFMASYAGMPVHTALLITVLTLLWALVLFLLWQRNRTRLLWPVFLGLLVACWWPALDWLAVKDLLIPGVESSTIILNLPWYATWTAKLIYALLPILGGYAMMWKLKYHRSNRDQTIP